MAAIGIQKCVCVLALNYLIIIGLTSLHPNRK